MAMGELRHTYDTSHEIRRERGNRRVAMPFTAHGNHDETFLGSSDSAFSSRVPRECTVGKPSFRHPSAVTVDLRRRPYTIVLSTRSERKAPDRRAKLFNRRRAVGHNFHIHICGSRARASLREDRRRIRINNRTRSKRRADRNVRKKTTTLATRGGNVRCPNKVPHVV